MARRKPVAAFIGILLISVLLLSGGAAYWYLQPFRNFGSETFVEIDRGMSSRSIAKRLKQKGVIRSETSFLLIRLLHPSATLQAGEYRFAKAETPWTVFDTIRRGQIFYEEFTIPEGSNIFDIAGMLRNGDTVRAEDFLRAAANPASIRDLDSSAPSLEGYLFPSTYRVTHRTTAEQLCRMMTTEFRKQWSALSAGVEAKDVHRLVTLASLVEKETGMATERPLVAAVFFNRLDRGIPLQCDPTTVYAALLENRYFGVIHKSDLANTNPYNTYAHVGLPPGPISNPGAASLKAVLNPAHSTFLYFVAKADGSGTHNFSTTLEEHDRAVESYRRAHP